MKNRSWAEVNLGTIVSNVDNYRKSLKESHRILTVIKANGYGHGDLEVAKALQDAGIRNFAVATLSEGIKLREAGIQGQILILGYTDASDAEELCKYDITQTLVSEEHAEAFSASNYPVKCQFALDTGMNRIGLDADDPVHCEDIIRKYYHSLLNINGFFTHLCVADTDDEESIQFTKTQIAKYEVVAERLQNLNLPFIHCLNSAGGLHYSSKFGSLVRLGIVMYGLKPDYTNKLPKGIEPALSWKSVVEMVKPVHPGETIGYGRTYRAEHEMQVATIATGYADGYPRLLSNKGYVLINGKQAPIVGNICMDQFMVDVTGIEDVHMGSIVTLIGRDGDEMITADELGHMIGTIGYEIVCGISHRVERIMTK